MMAKYYITIMVVQTSNGNHYSLNDLADVDTTGVANAKILKYDSGSANG